MSAGHPSKRRGSSAGRVRACMVAGTLLLVSACSSVPDIEQRLVTSGFDMHAADTPERQAQLAALPPHQLVQLPSRPGDEGTVGYVYADPDRCHCLYTGSAAAYQTYERITRDERTAAQRRAAAMDRHYGTNWDAWGPGFW